MIVSTILGNQDAVIAAMEIAKKSNVKTLTNAAPARADLDPRIYQLTDILCVNETEAQIILGQENVIETEEAIEDAMQQLLKKCHSVVVTLGAKGAVCASRNEPKPVWVKAEKATKVVDTTGAGDAFVGSMSYYLVNHPGLKLSDIVERSCKVATVTVQKEGTQTSFPFRKSLPSELF